MSCMLMEPENNKFELGLSLIFKPLKIKLGLTITKPSHKGLV